MDSTRWYYVDSIRVSESLGNFRSNFLIALKFLFAFFPIDSLHDLFTKGNLSFCFKLWVTKLLFFWERKGTWKFLLLTFYSSSTDNFKIISIQTIHQKQHTNSLSLVVLWCKLIKLDGTKLILSCKRHVKSYLCWIVHGKWPILMENLPKIANTT